MALRGMFFVAARKDHVVAVVRTDGGTFALRFAGDGSVAPVTVDMGGLAPVEPKKTSP